MAAPKLWNALPERVPICWQHVCELLMWCSHTCLNLQGCLPYSGVHLERVDCIVIVLHSGWLSQGTSPGSQVPEGRPLSRFPRFRNSTNDRHYRQGRFTVAKPRDLVISREQIVPSVAYEYAAAFRLVFNWVLKVILLLLWFCITMLCDWFKISRHFLDQSEVKPKPSWLARMRFPALGAGCMHLLRALIG